MKRTGPEVVQLVTSAQMRAIENAAMAAGRATGLQLMERAGEAVAEAVPDWPAPRLAAILCGPGNNGGDGFVVARLLAGRGWQVQVFALGWEAVFPELGPPGPVRARQGTDACTNARRWRDEGGSCRPLAALAEVEAGRILVVDALLGIGQTRPCDTLLEPYWRARDGWDRAGAEVRTLSVDVPTGFDCDSGMALARRPFEADLVVTFHAEKPVHARLRTAGVAVRVADIGLGS
nr:NAD(P)H-hydrate epimerase [Cereibacter sphaeroides f. sp. denitrificans]